MMVMMMMGEAGPKATGPKATGGWPEGDWPDVMQG